MHNNYYFLKQLSTALHGELAGFTLVSCFCQNKDELVLEFNNAKSSFFIKASLLPHFCCLSFPSSFQRAKKNSIDLFNEVLMQEVTAVKQFSNERSFQIVLTQGWSIVFKMHGNRANVLLAKDDQVFSVFKSQLTADYSLDLSTLHRSLEQEQPETLAQAKATYFTWSKPMWEHLELALKEKPQETFRTVFNEVQQKLDRPDYCILKHQQTFQLSLLRYGVVEEVFDDPIAALNSFFIRYTSSQAFQTEKDRLLKTTEVKIQNGKAYLQKNEQKLREIQEDQQYQQWGDLIMANMHAIAPGVTSIVLPSFYNDQQVTIKLNAQLSLQKNAAVFYRKAKNKQIEIDQLKKSIDQKKRELEDLTILYEKILSAQDFPSLKATGARQVTERNNQQPVSLPYHEFTYQGYRIWVGRNAISNDVLTLKLAYKEDLWLHAKDVAGSHVIIKHQAGKNFPKEVITYAAQLAAYNSKRKTEALCPVAVTSKKFVRKRKGDPAGMVVVEREEVILVEPKPN